MTKLQNLTITEKELKSILYEIKGEEEVEIDGCTILVDVWAYDLFYDLAEEFDIGSFNVVNNLFLSDEVEFNKIRSERLK